MAAGVGAGGEDAVSTLGQAVADRLFSVGLDLNYLLVLIGDEVGANRLRHALKEIDEAIGDLRLLMIAPSKPD